MLDRRENPCSADLPPLRILMGGAIAFAGGVAWHQADAQSTEGEPVELAPIPIEGGSETGYRTPVPQLPKLSQPLLDTPQSVNVVPRALMDDQGITATRDALRTVPGISPPPVKRALRATISLCEVLPRETISTWTACGISAVIIATRSIFRKSRC